MNSTKLLLAVAAFLFVVQTSAGFANPPAPPAPVAPVACAPARAGVHLARYAQKQKKDNKSVYVCGCLGDASCACMSEALDEGPCACGTKGGPPMRRVASDSNWAKANRNALTAGK